jgi:hypothetical protein
MLEPAAHGEWPRRLGRAHQNTSVSSAHCLQLVSSSSALLCVPSASSVRRRRRSAKRLAHPHGNHDAGRERERGHEPHRGGHAERIRGEAGQERADQSRAKSRGGRDRPNATTLKKAAAFRLSRWTKAS